MIIKVFGWIPRSYVHVAEVVSKVNVKGLDFDIDDVNYNNNVSFIVKEFKNYKNLKFNLGNDGLYSLSAKVPEENIDKTVSDFYAKAKEFLLEKIVKNFHKVTYVQIIDGILPMNFFTIIVTGKEHAIKGYEVTKFNGLRVYSRKSDVYSSDSFMYISGNFTSQVEAVLDLFAFSVIASHFLFDMMNRMESYHNGTKEVIRLLEHEPNSELINNAYLNLDLVKKDAAESWAKVEQAIDCITRRERDLDAIKSGKLINELIKGFGIIDNFRKVDADKNYILSLWTLLINHLEYVDTAVEARLNYKKALNNSAAQWLNFVNSGFIIASILTGLLFLSSGMSAVFIVSGLLATWFIVYIVVNYVTSKRNS